MKATLIDLKVNVAELGKLIAIENDFLDIERVFFIYDVPNKKTRGMHARKTTTQLLICVSGSCEVTCDEDGKKNTFLLNNPSKALLIPPNVWDQQRYLSDDTVLLVLADTYYDPKDYIGDYNEFLKKCQKS